MRRAKWLALGCLLAASGAAADSRQALLFDGHVREMPPGQATTAAYGVISNPGGEPVKVVDVSCDCAEAVSIHTQRRIDGRLRMEPAGDLDVPAGGSLELRPGALHLMLVGLTRVLRAGEHVRLTLVDADGTRHRFDVPVERLDTGGHHHH